MTTTHEPENPKDKKKILTYSLAGLGAALVLAGGITLTTQGQDQAEHDTASEQTSTQQTSTNAEENTPEKNPDMQQKPGEQPVQQPEENPQHPAPQGHSNSPEIQDYTQEEKDALNKLFELGNNIEGDVDYSSFAQDAKEKNAFGKQIHVNGVDVTVSNPRTQNGKFTVDVQANNTTDQTQAFSGILFGAGNSPENYAAPTTESMVALNTEPLAPHQKLSGSLTFDVDGGHVFFLDLVNGATYLWQ